MTALTIRFTDGDFELYNLESIIRFEKTTVTKGILKQLDRPECLNREESLTKLQEAVQNLLNGDLQNVNTKIVTDWLDRPQKVEMPYSYINKRQPENIRLIVVHAEKYGCKTIDFTPKPKPTFRQKIKMYIPRRDETSLYNLRFEEVEAWEDSNFPKLAIYKTNAEIGQKGTYYLVDKATGMGLGGCWSDSDMRQKSKLYECLNNDNYMNAWEKTWANDKYTDILNRLTTKRKEIVG